MRCGWGRPPTAAWRGVGPRDCRGWPTAARVVFKNGWVSVRFSTLLRVKRAGWSLVLSREGAEPTAPPPGSRSCAVKLTAPRGRVQNHPIIRRLEGEKIWEVRATYHTPFPVANRCWPPETGPLLATGNGTAACAAAPVSAATLPITLPWDGLHSAYCTNTDCIDTSRLGLTRWSYDGGTGR